MYDRWLELKRTIQTAVSKAPQKHFQLLVQSVFSRRWNIRERIEHQIKRLKPSELCYFFTKLFMVSSVIYYKFGELDNHL